jgi:AraC-like DNA-binding protein
MEKSMKLEDQLPVIHSMGNLIFDPVWSVNNHMSRNCELLHIISGSVSLVMNRRKIKASAGDTLLVPSKTLHRDEFDFGEGLKVFMIQFHWSCEKDFFSRLSCSSLMKLSKPKKESIANLIQQFRGDFTGGNSLHDFVLRIRLSEILMRMLVLSEKEKNRTGNNEIVQAEEQSRGWIVKKVKAFLEDNYSRPLSLEEIARHANVSPFHLCRIFSHENDFTIFEYLTHIRMTKARCLLDEGKLSISETAYAVGFNNSNYFSKVFHRFFGFPPNRMLRKLFSFKRS